MMADEDNNVCPICKSDKYLNPQLRILISPCYHKMCDACVDRIFSLGPSPCPICSQTLRKAGFTEQKFEDLGVEKEVRIRQRVAKIFNKTAADFETDRQYDDYLEEVENLTWALIEGNNLDETEAKIQQYQRENQDLVKRNEKVAQAQNEIAKKQIEAERIKRLEERQRARREEEEARLAEEQDRRELLRALEDGKQDPSQLIAKGKAVTAARQQAQGRDMMSGSRDYNDDAPEDTKQDFDVDEWGHDQIVGKYGLAYTDYVQDDWPPKVGKGNLTPSLLSSWYADSNNEKQAIVAGQSIERLYSRYRREAWAGLLKRPRT